MLPVILSHLVDKTARDSQWLVADFPREEVDLKMFGNLNDSSVLAR